MAITTIRCPVAQRTVTRVTDFEDTTTRIICPEFEEPTGICRLKQRTLDGGLLSQLLGRVSEETLGSRSIQCNIR